MPDRQPVLPRLLPTGAGAVVLTAPAGQQLPVAVGLVGKGHVARSVEQLPPTVGDAVGHRLGQQGRALIVRSADDQARLGDLSQPGRAVEVFQIAPRGVLVRSPRHVVALRAEPLLTAETLGAVGGDRTGIKLRVMVVGLQICGIVEIAGRLRLPDGSCSASGMNEMSRCCS